MIKKKKGMSAGKGAVIGAGLAVVGAGAYYLLGPKSKQHQKKAKIWMAKMEKDAKIEFKKVEGEWKKIKPKVDSVVKKAKKAVK